MHEMFELGMEWWEFVVRAVAVYVVVLLLTRMSGKRSMGQSTPFDILVIVLLGTAVQNSLIGEDTSLPGGLILAATLIGLNWFVGFLGARSKRQRDRGRRAGGAGAARHDLLGAGETLQCQPGGSGSGDARQRL